MNGNGFHVEEVTMLSNEGSNEHETSSSSNKDKVFEAGMPPGPKTNQQNPSEKGVMASETNSFCMLALLFRNFMGPLLNDVRSFPLFMDGS